MTRAVRESRKYIRYDLDEGSLADVVLLFKDTKVSSLRGLVINSSFGGCELLLMSKYTPCPQQKLDITFPEAQLSDLGTFNSRIIWVKQLDSDVYKIGVQYIE